MSLFALDPLWNDIYTAGGFWIGVLGTFVGVAGFWIAIKQIRETRKAAEAGKLAAEAAQEAAETALTESKESYKRFVGAFASRLLSELRTAVVDEDWKIATVRCHDLAEMLGTIATSSSEVGELIRELRDFGKKFTRRASGEKPKFSQPKWDRLVNGLHELLDQLNTPFRERPHGPVSAHNPAGEVPVDRPHAAGEDEGETGELGEESKG